MLQRLGALVATLVIFTVRIVFAQTPLEVSSYSRPSEYPHEDIAEGVMWDSHFTDLRVLLSNNSDSDYHDLDIFLKPDSWTYKAVFTHNQNTCELLRVNGTQLSFTKFKGSGRVTINSTRSGDVYDSQGDPYTSLATRDGYRIRCGSFPSHFEVEIRFAAVSLSKEYRIPTNTSEGPALLAYEDSSAGNMLDIFGSKPLVSNIVINAKYRCGEKPYAINNKTIHVWSGG